jgi:hypothetical protein
MDLVAVRFVPHRHITIAIHHIIPFEERRVCDLEAINLQNHTKPRLHEAV